MGATTTQFTLTVTAPAQTVIGKIADDLNSAFPSTPGWSDELGTSYYLADNHPDRGSGTKINDLIDRSGGGADAAGLRAFNAYSATGLAYGTLNGWAGKAHYDGSGFWYLSGTTGDAAHSQTAVRYSRDTDEFRHWQGANGSGGIFPHGAPHNFQQTCFDPVTRRLFRLTGGVTNQTNRVAWFNVDDYTSGEFTASYPAGAQISSYPAVAFLPSVGVAGSVVVLRRAASGYNAPIRFDVSEQTWYTDITGAVHTSDVCAVVCEHGGYIYFSFGQDGGVMHRLGSSKAVETLGTATPVVMDSSKPAGFADFALWAPMGDYIYAFCASGAIYRYDTVAQTWSAQLDTLPSRYIASNFTVAPIDDLGVFAFVTMATAFTEKALVWKP